MRNQAWTLATSLALLLTTAACGKDKASTTPEEGGAGAGGQEAAANKAESAGLIEVANGDLGRGRFVSARKRAEEALAADPNNADAYAVLGAAQWRAGRFAASTEAYRKAIELDANNFGANQGLGRNLQAAGKHSEAIELQDKLIATEKGEDDRQATPRMIKLWSQYALLQVDDGVKTADEIFTGVGGSEDQLNVVKAYAAFLRPLQGKGPFIEIEGAAGQSDLAVAQFKSSSARIGGKSSRVLWMEAFDEARIDAALAADLNLEEVGKVALVGGEESPIVIVPEISLGEITIKNVPAVVQDFETLYADDNGSAGMVLGRQVLQRFGAVSFDFRSGQVGLSVDAGTPTGAESQLLFIDLYALKVPSIEISIDGREHGFWVWLGSPGFSAATITSKDYLKSDHRPDDIYPPDDEAGQKMVLLDEVSVGSDVKAKGLGGVVLTASPPDAMLATIAGSGFELGGYLNYPLVKRWKVTYALGQGKVFIDGGAPATDSAE
ncbi:MAG: hypothetical protein B7733_23095 [Myxococcales bacterium FL481]|nr:MAG: hypothetical protein B7733_23095 [Myxococcales bacterium FL481]